MSTLIVQFADSTQAVITSYFTAPQPQLPNMGTVQSTDPKWKVFYDSIVAGVMLGTMSLLPPPT